MSSDVELIGDSPTEVEWHETVQTITNDEHIERLKSERDEAVERQIEAEKKLANEISRAAEMETRLSASKHQIAQLEKKIILDQNVNRQKLKSIQMSLNDVCERVKISDQSVFKAKMNQSLNEGRLKVLEDMLKIKDQALLAAETALISAQKKLSYNNQQSYQNDELSLIKKLTKRIEFCKSQVKIVVEQFVQDKVERKWALECVELENRVNEMEAALKQETWSKIQISNQLSELNQQLLDTKSDFSRRESTLLNNEKIAQERYESHMKMCCKQQEDLITEINNLKAKLEFTETKVDMYDKQLKDAQKELENISSDILNVEDQNLLNAKRQRYSPPDNIVDTIRSIAGNIENSLKQELNSITSCIEKMQYDKILKYLNEEIRKGFDLMRHQTSLPTDSIPQEMVKKLIVKCQAAEDKALNLEKSSEIPQEMVKKLIVKCQAAEEKALNLEKSSEIPQEMVKKLIIRCQAAEEKVSQLTKQLEGRNGKFNSNAAKCVCSNANSNGKFGLGWSIAKNAQAMESLAILKARLSMFKGNKSDIIPQDIAESLYQITESLYKNNNISSI